MSTYVMPLPGLSDHADEFHAVLALHGDGTIGVVPGKSLSDAVATLSSQCRPPTRCSPELTVLGKRHGWTVREATDDEHLARACIAWSLAWRMPPSWSEEVLRFLTAWRAFWPLRLWEQMPAEMALPLIHTRGAKRTAPCLAMLGQAAREFGLAVYESTDVFDQLWSDGMLVGRNRSVLAAADVLPDVFRPLGVPCPMAVVSGGLMPEAPRRDDLVLLRGALELSVGILERRPSVPLGASQTLELRRDRAPDATDSTKRKRRAKRRPA